jgi:hypothetical protein
MMESDRFKNTARRFKNTARRHFAGRPGRCSLIAMSNADAARILEPFGDAEVIPLPRLTDRLERELSVNFGMNERSYAVRHGYLEVLPQRARAGAYQVDRSEAERLVVAAILAAAVGVAVVTALSLLKSGYSQGLIKPALLMLAGQST